MFQPALLTPESLPSEELLKRLQWLKQVNRQDLMRHLRGWHLDKVKGYADVFMVAQRRLLDAEDYAGALEVASIVRDKYIRAVRGAFGQPIAHWHEANQLATIGDFPAAFALFEAIGSDLDGHPAFLLNRAAITRRVCEFTLAEERLEQLAAEPSTPPLVRIPCLAELARTHVLAGRPSAAGVVAERVLDTIRAQPGDERTWWLAQYTDLVVELFIAAGSPDSAQTFLLSSLPDSVAVDRSRLLVQVYLALGDENRARKVADHQARSTGEYTAEVELYKHLGRNHQVRRAFIDHVKRQMKPSTSQRMPHPVTGGPITVSFPDNYAVAAAGFLWALNHRLPSLADAFLLDATRDTLEEASGSLALSLLRNTAAYPEYVLHSGVLSDLVEEVAARFPENRTLHAHLGFYFAARGDAQRADSAYETAHGLPDADVSRLMSVHRLILKATLNPASVDVASLEQALKSLDIRDRFFPAHSAARWAQATQEHVFARAIKDDLIQSTGGFVAHASMRPILIQAAQASIALGDFQEAAHLYELATIHFLGRDGWNRLPRGMDVPQYVQLNSLWGTAAGLSGDAAGARERLDVSLRLSRDETITSALQSIVAFNEGRHVESIKGLTDAALDKVLRDSIAEHYLGQLPTTKLGELKREELRILVLESSGRAPSRLQMLNEIDNLKATASEKEELVKAMAHREESFVQALHAILDKAPLIDDARALQRRLFTDLAKSNGATRAIERFVAEWANVTASSSTPSTYLAALRKTPPPEMRERIVAAETYAEVARARSLDFGPAYLALASVLEYLGTRVILTPVRKALTRASLPKHERPDTSRESLGTLTNLLPPRGVQVFASYRALLEKTLRKEHGTQVAEQLLSIGAEAFAVAVTPRNDWAHGKRSITADEYHWLEQICFQTKPPLLDSMLP